MSEERHGESCQRALPTAVPAKETRGHFNIRAALCTTLGRPYEGRAMNFLSQCEIWSYVLLRALSLAPDHCSHLRSVEVGGWGLDGLVL